MPKNKPLTDDEAREMIDLRSLITLVQDNAMGRIDPPLNQSRLHSARLLIDKRMANLQAAHIDLSGEVEIKVLKVADHQPASE